MGVDDSCNTGLVLSLGFSSTLQTPSKPYNKNPSFLKLEPNDEPSLTLALSGVAGGVKPASPLSCVSSFSSGNKPKRERELSSDEDEERTVNGRKKLRLSKEQSSLLEESFKQHSTLNPKQKQALARQLNLKPRQVEVWFQNRRARTKLKQTEVDCEFLKKCYETLTDENRRLQKEVQELKALKLAAHPFHMQAATLTICPSCERTAASGGVIDGDGNSKNLFSLASKTHHLYNNPLTNPSAAC
ncbi:hypothetical protein ERO13_D03G031800v2 [Gossypium hirsutum]|uniref:Homeobox-leucine zipper protein HAT22 n=1 Tax=Gossypium hirsutum TaxID=3635 RepID=A0A1U8NPF8_GOSHI|nr:homeobox-leucine zipper protein HAT22 [Gossypium hirsutum]KAG4154026.1 hypothetical protein ERO13_D03G031800v2 [Gossypium hirsutum]